MEKTFSVDQAKHIIEAHHTHNERAFIEYTDFSWEANDTKMDPDWQEVAFIDSWSREKKARGDER